MGIGCISRRVWQWILLGWQSKQDFAQLLTSLARLHQTNLEDITRREASLPGWEMLCKCKKMSFWNFAGTMGQMWKHCQPGVERLLVGKQV
jgi:hypothetical protein